MSFRVDRCLVELSQKVQREKLTIQDTLCFVEDPEFLDDFTACGLDDDDRLHLEAVLTVFPDGGEVVPVTENVRDALFIKVPSNPVVIRYVYLPPANTVLLLAAYHGTESLTLNAEEAEEAEDYISRQCEYFSARYTR